MVLSGRIDEKNQLWVPLIVGGLTQKRKIEVLVDTGFSGELALPLQLAIPLGLQLTAAGEYQYANGSRSIEMIFTGSLDWGSKNRLVAVNVLNSDVPLLGGGLLHGYTLTVDFKKKKLTIKEPGRRGKRK